MTLPLPAIQDAVLAQTADSVAALCIRSHQEPASVGGPSDHAGMTDLERIILAFADTHPDPRENDIRSLGVRPTRYWQILHRLVTLPEVVAAYPMLCGRTVRLSEHRLHRRLHSRSAV